MDQTIDLWSLLPNPSILWPLPQLSALNSEQLSAIFFGLLVFVMLFFLIYALSKSRGSTKKIKKINELIKEDSSGNFPGKENIKEHAKKMGRDIAYLWVEFDESLLERKNPDKTISLVNTLDAAHFFNTSTLAAGITENRFLAAAPGILTGIGVLGTFVGLQLGLSGLDIDNVDIEQMKSGLTEVISGAKIAFLTSVWGVLLSLVFNVIEKRLERSIRKKINMLQQRVDSLFPRLTAESQLLEIASNSRESKEGLKHFAEQIGKNLQTTVQEFGDRIDDSIKGIGGAGVAANEQALATLLERFLKEFGAVGGDQAEEMRKANERFTDSLNTLDSSIALLLKQLEASQKDGAEREQELIKRVSEQVDQLVANSQKQQKVLTDTIDKKLSELLSQFDRQDESASERDKARNDSVNVLLKRLEDGLNAQLESSKKLLSQGESLQNSVNVSIQGNIEASTRMQESAHELNQASQQIKGTGFHMEQAGQSIAGAIQKASESTSQLAQGNQTVLQQLNKQQTLLDEQQQRFNDSIDQMTLMFDRAEGAFDKLDEKQQHFLKRLDSNVNLLTESTNKHIKDLSGALSKMLLDYSQQVDDHTQKRLKIWLQHTTSYTTVMQEAINALSAVVDEIQDKVGVRY